ncbi:MAG: hypothetical protein ACYDBQ_11730 [Thermoplasmatota archaeon]
MPRIQSKDVMHHPTRAAIVALLEARPGISFRKILLASGVGSGTAAHHLRVLRRAGRVWSTPHAGSLLHFAGPKPEAAKAQQVVVENVLPGIDRTILVYLRMAGPSNQTAVIKAPGLETFPRATIQHHLGRLRERGFIRETRQGRRAMYETMA